MYYVKACNDFVGESYERKCGTLPEAIDVAAGLMAYHSYKCMDDSWSLTIHYEYTAEEYVEEPFDILEKLLKMI